jgi:catechol 2,3-dioxygenase
MTYFPVEGLRSVDFHVPDLSAAEDFYTRVWGLSVADRNTGSVWLRGSGTDAHMLALHSGDRPTMRSMTLRVEPSADLSELKVRLATAGARITRDISSQDEHGGGTGFTAQDQFGRVIRLVQNDERAEELPDAGDVPERLAHVNLNSDAVDRDAAFFIDALGFKLTDRSKMMAFVRTNPDHHTIVIADAPVNTLNHVAFQLRTWEDVMTASGRMIDNGFPIGWGPGRHGPGDNVFSYFVDPFGFVIEYTAEVLQVDDDYRVGRPEDWVWPAGRTDQWGICPPKTSECKAAQLAIPFERQL